MSGPRLLATDLDRTLLPNGDAVESPGVRARLAELVARHGIRLAYVTGRHRALVEEAIRTFELPRPDLVITDVGTTIHRIEGDAWVPDERWAERLGECWEPGDAARARGVLATEAGVVPQEAERQGEFKESYFTPLWSDPGVEVQRIRERLAEANVDAEVIHSIDDAASTGLLDLLPAGAGKRAAIEYLLEVSGLSPGEVLFAGDSGNDLDALVAGFPGVLVANASDEVREAARARSREAGTEAMLHLARGMGAGLDGNYAAGIVEGLAHFWPDLEERW